MAVVLRNVADPVGVVLFVGLHKTRAPQSPTGPIGRGDRGAQGTVHGTNIQSKTHLPFGGHPLSPLELILETDWLCTVE